MSLKKLTFALTLLFLFSCSAASPRSTSSKPPLPLAVVQNEAERLDYEAAGSQYAIATQGRAAAIAADRMYALGGNIIDAAVAASFAISVERPHSTGIGGGGFLLFHEAATGKTYAVDFRERAPLLATRNMYLDAKGEFAPDRSLNGILAVATPGLVAGLVEIHEKWGKLKLAQVIEPAAELAEKGFPVYPALGSALERRKEVLALDPEAKKIFLRSDGSALTSGELLVQKDLAGTLRKIASHGKKGFYSGATGRSMLDFFQKQGGLIRQKDFSDYRVKWRAPVKGNFQDVEIFSMPPPSSGGIHVLQILNVLENDPLKQLGALSAGSIHRVAASMQLAFADRAVYPGDPDFVKVPTEWLTSKSYARARRSLIDDKSARASSEIQAGTPPSDGHNETTHFSIMDKAGNAVASTQTINFSFGSGVVVPGTGILLNDEMDDFSGKAGAANAYGAIGGEANSIAGGKTPLSSMSPTIVMKNGRPIVAVGAPGGTRIISCVAQTLLNYLTFGLSAYESVAAVRFHHQWQPDELQVDSPGPGNSVVSELERMGWKVSVAPGMVFCRVELVTREGDTLRAVSDPRDYGHSIAK